MGIQAVVEGENGAKIALEDPTNILHRVIPAHDDVTFNWLSRVDWYGDTTFNRHQIPDVRKELQRLMHERAEELDFLRQLDALAARSEAELHLYLKFYGD